MALFDQPAQEPESVGVMAPVESLTKSLAEKSQISSPSEQGMITTCVMLCLSVCLSLCISVCLFIYHTV